MSFDAWIVGIGLSTLLRVLHLVDGLEAYWVLALVAGIDTILLVRFFRVQRRALKEVLALTSTRPAP